MTYKTRRAMVLVVLLALWLSLVVWLRLGRPPWLSTQPPPERPAERQVVQVVFGDRGPYDDGRVSMCLTSQQVCRAFESKPGEFTLTARYDGDAKAVMEITPHQIASRPEVEQDAVRFLAEYGQWPEAWVAHCEEVVAWHNRRINEELNEYIRKRREAEEDGNAEFRERWAEELAPVWGD